MASRSKAVCSERNRPKSTLILTVNHPIHPYCKAKSRLPHRPIDSACGTGGLDFLIAHALMILCHSLFEVVIEQVFEWHKIGQSLFCVLILRNGDVPHPFFREQKFQIVVHHHMLLIQLRTQSKILYQQ